jgi:hypothetical protein
MFIGSKFPKSDFAMNRWIDRLKNELLELEKDGMEFTDERGRKWKIFLTITSLSMDLDVINKKYKKKLRLIY